MGKLKKCTKCNTRKDKEKEFSITVDGNCSRTCNSCKIPRGKAKKEKKESEDLKVNIVSFEAKQIDKKVSEDLLVQVKKTEEEKIKSGNYKFVVSEGIRCFRLVKTC